MRTLVAIVVVLVLLVMALGMATSLQWYRRRHTRQRRFLEAQGRRVVAEVPVPDGLAYFSEADEAFFWGDQLIPKDEIRAARILISGAPLSSIRSSRFPASPETQASSTEPGAVERERWGVEIELGDATVLVECGSIRQQVSQELARSIYESVRRAIDTGDRDVHHSVS